MNMINQAIEQFSFRTWGITMLGIGHHHCIRSPPIKVRQGPGACTWKPLYLTQRRRLIRNCLLLMVEKNISHPATLFWSLKTNLNNLLRLLFLDLFGTRNSHGCLRWWWEWNWNPLRLSFDLLRVLDMAHARDFRRGGLSWVKACSLRLSSNLRWDYWYGCTGGSSRRGNRFSRAKRWALECYCWCGMWY